MAALAEFISRRSGLTTQAIASTGQDLANSAMEVVGYFAGGYQESLENLVQKWHPSGETAEQWHQGMLWYLESSFTPLKFL